MLDECHQLFDPASATLLQGHVDAINANSSLGWDAALYPNFALQDLETTRRTALGYQPSELTATRPEPLPLTAEEMLQLPESYDHRVEMQAANINCKTWSVGEQKSCGACWAFATARVYNERLCRASRGRVNIQISEQDMVSCYAGTNPFDYTHVQGKQQVTGRARGSTGQSQDGCGGGAPVNALLQMVDAGRVSRWADAYVAQGYRTQPCGQYDSANSLKYQLDAQSIWRITSGDIALIQAQVRSGGPVTAGVEAYQDLLAYKSGVYVRSSAASLVGMHLVALIGWGSTNGKRYWTFANSWGSGWGENGYGRIQHGQAGIEREIVYPSVREPQQCAASAACKNGGEFTADCGCHCDGLWTGADCGTCAQTCENGGLMRQDSCSCSCVPGYFGTTCSEYLLAQWESRDGLDASVRFSWSLAALTDGSKFVRYAKTFDSAGIACSIQGPQAMHICDLATSNNPMVGGYDVSITSSKGAQSKTIHLNSRLPKPYPNDVWAYAVHFSLGKNEFGQDKGYQVLFLPPLVYNRSASCLSGGHKPGSWSTAHICVGSHPDALQPAGTAAPVERATAYPTSPPTQADCRTRGTPYQGQVATTDSGKKCQSWDGRDGYEYMNGQGAVCRETRDSPDKPWCFTEAVPGNTYAYCTVPVCVADPPSSSLTTPLTKVPTAQLRLALPKSAPPRPPKTLPPKTRPKETPTPPVPTPPLLPSASLLAATSPPNPGSTEFKAVHSDTTCPQSNLIAAQRSLSKDQCDAACSADDSCKYFYWRSGIRGIRHHLCMRFSACSDFNGNAGTIYQSRYGKSNGQGNNRAPTGTTYAKQGAAHLLFDGKGCKSQGANLGTGFSSPLACLQAAAARSACSDALQTVMWSPAYNSAWGCRCCSETGTMADHTNTNWQIYALQRGASTEAPTRMPSAVPIPTRLPTELPTEEPNTILLTASPTLSPIQADCKTPGTPYQGELAVTETGTKCQSWDNREGYDYMNGRGAVCRETRDSAGTPWCFTTAAPGNTWNYCSVESCRLVSPPSSTPSFGPSASSTRSPTRPSTRSPTSIQSSTRRRSTRSQTRPSTRSPTSIQSSTRRRRSWG